MSTCIPCMDGNHRNCGYGNRVDMLECRCDGRTPDCPGQALQQSGFTFGQAVDRIELARQALIADGYFTADEVGDDIAPRISELSSHLRHRIENLENRIGATTLYWECATCMDGQDIYRLTRPCTGGSESVECENCDEPMRLMMTHIVPVPDSVVTAVLAAADFKRRLRQLATSGGYSKVQLDLIAAGMANLAQLDPEGTDPHVQLR